MSRAVRSSASLLSAAAMVVTVVAPVTAAAPRPAGMSVRTLTGRLSDGATYRIEVPARWNGTLALYGHGLRFPGQRNPPASAFDAATRRYLTRQGYALAGSSYAHTGWAVAEALRDQRATLAQFRRVIGTPTHVVAWGISLGGLVSAELLERNSVDAALPMCAPLAGGPALWNSYLDGAFVLRTLVAPRSGLELTHITDPVANITTATRVIFRAAASARGWARLALAAAVLQLPGRIDPDAPAPQDVTDRVQARIRWLHDAVAPLAFGERAELESRAGGNPSGNRGVDYRAELRRSRQFADVKAVYAEAGLSLRADLLTLARAHRVRPEAAAVHYLRRHGGLSGSPRGPVLTLHDVDDGLLPTAHERAYAGAVARAGRSAMLRRVSVDRAGHCVFTPAEVLTAFQALTTRLRTGHWPELAPAVLNRSARALGPRLNAGGGHPVAPAFTVHHPLPYPRGGSTSNPR